MEFSAGKHRRPRWELLRAQARRDAPKLSKRLAKDRRVPGRYLRWANECFWRFSRLVE
jgi:hypothetical protein